MMVNQIVIRGFLDVYRRCFVVVLLPMAIMTDLTLGIVSCWFPALRRYLIPTSRVLTHGCLVAFFGYHLLMALGAPGVLQKAGVVRETTFVVTIHVHHNLLSALIGLVHAVLLGARCAAAITLHLVTCAVFHPGLFLAWLLGLAVFSSA